LLGERPDVFNILLLEFFLREGADGERNLLKVFFDAPGSDGDFLEDQR
jgi:hypothetical protein